MVLSSLWSSRHTLFPIKFPHTTTNQDEGPLPQWHKHQHSTSVYPTLPFAHLNGFRDPHAVANNDHRRVAEACLIQAGERQRALRCSMVRVDLRQIRQNFFRLTAPGSKAGGSRAGGSGGGGQGSTRKIVSCKLAERIKYLVCSMYSAAYLSVQIAREVRCMYSIVSSLYQAESSISCNRVTAWTKNRSKVWTEWCSIRLKC